MIPSAGIFVLAVLIIKLSPNLVFEPAILEWVCLAYALIISLMVGKAVSVFAKERNRFTVLLFVGVLLFVISDVALIFNMFADGGRIGESTKAFNVSEELGGFGGTAVFVGASAPCFRPCSDFLPNSWR